MAKAKYQLEDFLAAVEIDDCKGFVAQTHDLLKDSYKLDIKPLAYGLSATYSQKSTKTGMLKFSFTKAGQFVVRIYANNHAKYPDVINGLPDGLKAQIAKSPICKKAVDPQKCWDGCNAMYEFYIGEDFYQKCAYDCFLFEVSVENIPYLRALIENETRERGAKNEQ